MRRNPIYRTASFALASLAFAAFSAQAVGQTTSFGYDCVDCPSNWGNLSVDFAACGEGTEQSPIAFDRESAVPGFTQLLLISYADSPLRVEHKETNFESFVEEGSSTIRLGGTRYDLEQFHFHSTAEHVLDGERAALEWHFVHKSEDGETVVIGVFVEEGENFDELDPLIAALPEVAGTAIGDSVGVQPIDIDSLLPDDISSYRYAGSTTTPACSEGVSWVLLQESVEFSESQIEEIRETIFGFNDGFDNNRPIAVRNGRVIETDFVRSDDDDDDDDD